jgi:bifunctional NMN adenylyltransferase/nudix hydrolase
MQDHAAPGATAESVPPSASERVHTAVLIGRFQPLHNGHMALLQAALARSDQVVVVLGSAWQAPNPKNPFSWQERAQMLREALPPADAARLRCVPVRDYYNEPLWCRPCSRPCSPACPKAPAWRWWAISRTRPAATWRAFRAGS